jgi:hypothetical protein
LVFNVSFSCLSKVSILLFFVLFAGCSGNKDKKPIPAPPADQAGSAADPDKGALAVAKSEEWSRREDSDQMDGRKTITYEIRSTNNLYLYSRETKVTMGLQCGKDVFQYVVSGKVSTPSMRYKFDDSAPSKAEWYILQHGAIAHYLTSKKFLQQLLQAKTFKFEFTPDGQAPQVASFDLGNIGELIRNEKVCDFQKKAKGD